MTLLSVVKDFSLEKNDKSTKNGRLSCFNLKN